jgi:RimJ/RimL family protein N-acetyltransferase
MGMVVTVFPQSAPDLPAPPFRLRNFRDDDLDLVRQAAADPHIPLITTVPSAFSEGEARRYIDRQLQRPREGIYSFVIAAEDTDEGVGSIALLCNVGHGRASIGYWVVAAHRGRGAASRGLRAVSAWGLRELRIPRLELYVEPWNVASIAVAERNAFRREGLLRSWQHVGQERRDMVMYSLLERDLAGTLG